MKFGYARVSTEDQNLDRQINILKESGCNRIYTEKISGIKSNRIELNNMINQLREGDVVIITDLTRLSRSVKDLFNLIGVASGKCGFHTLRAFSSLIPTVCRFFIYLKVYRIPHLLIHLN